MATIVEKSRGNGPEYYQEKLATYCKEQNLSPPVYNIISDRRGGRTAWTATATVKGEIISAKFWYDGQYVQNAKEDAAERMLLKLMGKDVDAEGTVRRPVVGGQGSVGSKVHGSY